MSIYIISDIEWDARRPELPKQLMVQIDSDQLDEDEELATYIGEAISNQYGFTISGFTYERQEIH